MKLFGRTFHLHDKDDWAKFEEAGGYTKVCPDVVGKAAQWVLEILHEEGLLKRNRFGNQWLLRF